MMIRPRNDLPNSVCRPSEPAKPENDPGHGLSFEAMTRKTAYNDDWRGSLTPRGQAIAKSYRDLMEKVKSMPEHSYELTLKDLVEETSSDRPGKEGEGGAERVAMAGARETVSENERWEMMHRQDSIKNERRGRFNGNGSIDQNGGSLLKVIFPLGLKTRSGCEKNGLAKVSPNLEVFNKSVKLVEKYEFERRTLNSRTSKNGVSRTGGSWGACRKKVGVMVGCWTFLFPKKASPTKAKRTGLCS